MNDKRKPARTLKPINYKEKENSKDKFKLKSIIKRLSNFFEIAEDNRNKDENKNLKQSYKEYNDFKYENFIKDKYPSNGTQLSKPSDNKRFYEKEIDYNKTKTSHEKDLIYSKINKVSNIKNQQNNDLINKEKLNELSYPRLKKEKRNLKNKSPLKSIQSKIEEYEKTGHFGFNLTKYEKNKMGIIIFFILFIIIIGGSYYFFIYEPNLKELNKGKITKLDEVNLLFKGPLTSSQEAIILEDKINKCNSKVELEEIDVLRPATTHWKDYHLKKINDSCDSGGRVMISSTIANKKNIISVDEAKRVVLDNDGYVLSNIEFEKPNTVAVPIQVSRLQACNGLIKTGSKIDIYCVNNTELQTNENTNNITNNSINYNNTLQTNNTNQNPYIFNNEISSNLTNESSIRGCTVLAIIRSKESGTINTEISQSKSLNNDKRNKSYENDYTYSNDVLEDLKTYAIEDYNGDLTEESLNEYGIKLSEYERESNLGDLNCEYLILIEMPREDVQYTLNNMNNIILTIPTQEGPDWMIKEIKENNNVKNNTEEFKIL